jgi:hypothetical protein
MLPATHCPWVVQTRVRGNPERVSNTAGDAESHFTRTLDRAQDPSPAPIPNLEFELLALLDGAFDALAQGADPATGVTFELLELRIVVLQS